MEFDTETFDTACAELLDRATAERPPDVLVAIPTGGMFVAEAMGAAKPHLPILPLTCRRRTTEQAWRAFAVRSAAATLPRPLLDRLRVVEHRILTRRRTSPAASNPPAIDAGQLDALRTWLDTVGGSPSVLVVDDAVDSGSTLARVVAAVRALLPPAADLRSAVISVTTDRPRIEPTYTLHRGQLCRFPWSLDSAPQRRS